MPGADSFAAGDVNDIFTGRAGDDTLDGQFGYDRANYGGATGSIDVELANGIVTGTGIDESGVGTDTLRSIELVTGGNYDDTFDARGFSALSEKCRQRGHQQRRWHVQRVRGPRRHRYHRR